MLPIQSRSDARLCFLRGAPRGSAVDEMKTCVNQEQTVNQLKLYTYDFMIIV